MENERIEGVAKVEALLKDAEAKHEEWALEADAAADYVCLACGLKLWKPTLPHVWAIARASQAWEGKAYEMNLVVAWLLGHQQEAVRNELMPLLRKSSAEELVARAEDFLMAAGAYPMDVLPVVAALTQEAFGAKKKTVKAPA